MADGRDVKDHASMKIRKPRYLGNGITNRRESWHSRHNGNLHRTTVKISNLWKSNPPSWLLKNCDG